MWGLEKRENAGVTRARRGEEIAALEARVEGEVLWDIATARGLGGVVGVQDMARDYRGSPRRRTAFRRAPQPLGHETQGLAARRPRVRWRFPIGTFEEETILKNLESRDSSRRAPGNRGQGRLHTGLRKGTIDVPFVLRERENSPPKVHTFMHSEYPSLFLNQKTLRLFCRERENRRVARACLAAGANSRPARWGASGRGVRFPSWPRGTRRNRSR